MIQNGCPRFSCKTTQVAENMCVGWLFALLRFVSTGSNDLCATDEPQRKVVLSVTRFHDSDVRWMQIAYCRTVFDIR